MKIAWYSNSPDTPTGYGVQTAQVTRRMAADGHEVHVLSNFGHRAGVKEWNGITIWPEGVANYSLDVTTEFARLAEADVVFTLYDVWVLRDEWPDRRVISWTPIDHYPPPPDVLRWARAHETIAMSGWGAGQLREQGIEPFATIPHGVEPVYRPTPSDLRRRIGVPDDAFLVMMNAANIGNTPPRKAWGENMHALALLMARHPDAYLYLHTDIARPGGVPLPVIIEHLGIPAERVRAAHFAMYRGGLITPDEMARIYSMSDVLLATSKGEGFGIPVIEAMACGVPAIVSDFSAQPELVGETGWKVPGRLDFDWMQGAEFFTPDYEAIASALEDAYAHRGERADACVERSLRFDADLLYEQHWRPLLAGIERDLAPKPARKGMSRGSQKRAKGAA